MAARGKVRRRANGELANGKRQQSPSTRAPLRFEVDETSVAEVPTVDLATAVTIRNRHIPINRAEVFALEEAEGAFGLDAREQLIENETRAAIGDDLYDAAQWRAVVLCRLLTREDPLYHGIEDDGVVVVDPDLLAHAASAHLPMIPDEELTWP